MSARAVAPTAARRDVATVRDAARNRWLDILPALAPALSEACARPGRHVPCPVHGGHDGFRLFRDAAETGGGVCNTCGKRSDGFALLQWVNRWDFWTAVERVADFLGLDVYATRRPAWPMPRRSARGRLTAIWQAAKPDPGRVADYLRHRGLSGTVPDALRFHPALPYHDDDKGHVGDFPAMVAQVQRLNGEVVALHRTYLSPDGPGKAPVEQAKKLTPAVREGATTGAAIRLAKAEGTLALAEGIETALAVMEAAGTPAWAAVSAGGLKAVELPAEVRRIEIWADHDSNGTGQEAAWALAARLHAEGREVRVLLPSQPDTDWLDVLNSEGAGALRAARAAAQPWTPPADDERADPFAHSRCGEYLIRAGRTYREKITRHDNQEATLLVPLANFAARVIEETALDDGAEVTRAFTLEGRMGNGRPLLRARVSAARFATMNWVNEVWGFGPSISPGQGAKDHLRAAIEAFSGEEVPRRTVFTHLGWRKTDAGWVFLHAGGAIGAEDVAVEAGRELEAYTLPAEPGDVLAAMRASLAFLEAGDPRATFPLWAAVWRAPVCEWLPCTVTLWPVGETGTRKTSTVALALSHFGGPFGIDAMPASWQDTENRLERRAFLAKDVLLAVDDYAPERHPGMAQELERRASRLLRSVGNRDGRGRLRADLTERPTYFPRGVVVATAEQIPSLAPSALARMLPIPFDAATVDLDNLGALQRQAHLLPHALRGFIEHLRGQADELGCHLRQRFEDLRNRAAIDGHPRLPEAVAHVFIGLELGISYAAHVGALNQHRAGELLAQGWAVLIDLAREHGKLLAEERPTKVFLQAIREGLAAGRCWLAHRETGELAAGRDGPGSDKLGWLDAQGVYLLPATAYAFASDRLRHRGGVVIGERALRAMLAKDGLLLRGTEERLDTKKRCESKPTWVLWLRLEALGVGEQ